jgi:DNA-binding LytR/AlgR family response regulator
MAYKAIIADDEKELRTYLKTMLAEVWPELEVCGEAENGKEAVKLIESERPRIAFLDIKMPGLSGMEVAKRIAGVCHIVFVTAYDQYAVEAFEREAVDYLLKPVLKERLVQSVQRLKHLSDPSVGRPGRLSEAVEEILARLTDKKGPDFLRWIKVQNRDGIRVISVDEVYYFKAEDKYTILVTKEGESLIKKSIKELARELDASQFWQIHRGIIVNISRIDRVGRSLTGRGTVKLKDRQGFLTVSRNYLHLFKQT